MITPKTKYFLLVCCMSVVLILTLNQTNDGVIYQTIIQNVTEHLYIRSYVERLANLTVPVVNVFPNISKSLVTQAYARGIYMYTAFKRQARNKSVVYINGWEDKSLKRPNLIPHCCFLLPNGSIFSEKTTTAVHFIYNPQLVAVLYGCNVPSHITESDRFAVSIAVLEPRVQKVALPAKKPAPAKKPMPGNKTVPAPAQPKKPVPPAKKPVAPAPGKAKAAPPVEKPAPNTKAQSNSGNKTALAGPAKPKVLLPPEKRPAPSAPVKAKAVSPVKTPPANTKAQIAPDNKTAPAAPAKPENPAPPAKKPAPAVPGISTLKEDNTKTVEKASENKTKTANVSEKVQADLNNISSTTLRKLLSVNVSNVGDNQTIAQKSSKTPVLNFICPASHNSYILPLQAIKVPKENEIPSDKGNMSNNTKSANGTRNTAQGEKNFSFAVCAKLVYGNVDLELTIEWLEYYRHMGASKVLAFTYNVTEEARRVIKHYEDSGFLETRRFDFPQPDKPYRRVGEKNFQAWNDEQVVVYHCYDRLINFKFVGVIDVDEFIVPHKDKNFEGLFNRLLKSQRMASDFMFPHMVHVLEWNQTSNDNLIVGSHLNHTANLGYNLKAVYMPERVPAGKVFTHGLFQRLPGFRAIHVLGTIAQLSHYRKKCRPEWVKSKTCFKKTTFTTTRILELMEDDLRETIKMKKKLLLNKK